MYLKMPKTFFHSNKKNSIGAATPDIRGGPRSSGWGRGGGIIFSKAWGLGATLRPSVGPGQRPGRGPGGEASGRS